MGVRKCLSWVVLSSQDARKAATKEGSSFIFVAIKRRIRCSYSKTKVHFGREMASPESLVASSKATWEPSA